MTESNGLQSPSYLLSRSLPKTFTHPNPHPCPPTVESQSLSRHHVTQLRPMRCQESLQEELWERLILNKVEGESGLLSPSWSQHRCDFRSAGGIFFFFCHHAEVSKHGVVSLSIGYTVTPLVKDRMLSWVSGVGIDLKQPVIFLKPVSTTVAGERIIWTDASQGKCPVSLGIWLWSCNPSSQSSASARVKSATGLGREGHTDTWRKPCPEVKRAHLTVAQRWTCRWLLVATIQCVCCTGEITLLF